MQQRPTPVSIFGILNIVYGVFALFDVGATMGRLATADASKSPVLKIMHEHPAYATWVKCTVPLSLLSFVLLVIAGFGLLSLCEWARKLSIAYGIYAILMGIGVSVINFIFVLHPGFAGAAHTNGGGGSVVAAAAIAIMTGVFALIYPVALIVFMTRPKIAAAFRPPPEPPVLSSP